jgi:hypothetical protein
MSTLINFASSSLPYFVSGMTWRLGTSLRLGIASYGVAKPRKLLTDSKTPRDKCTAVENHA